MTGSITLRVLPDGRKRYDVSWRDPNGRQRRKTFQQKKAAERFMSATAVSINTGAYADITPQLMDLIFDRWVSHSLETRFKTKALKSSTVKAYRSILATHLRPAFGTIRSDRLRASVVTDWAHARADDIDTGEMRAKTFNNVINLLHVILAWARHPAQAYIGHDPLVGLKRLPVSRIERAFLEPHQITAVLEAAPDMRDSTLLATAAFTGLRRGELVGLQWQDIDWRHGRIAVQRSVYQGAIDTPKTKTSVRRIDVPASVLAMLAIYRAVCPCLGPGFVFRTAAGRPLDGDNWHKRVLTPILTHATNVPPIGGLHALRHTYASLLINLGEPLTYVSRQMGHATIAITADLYGHLFKETGTAAMKRLDLAIGRTGTAKVLPITGTHGR